MWCRHGLLTLAVVVFVQVLGDKLYTFQWLGVFWNVVAVVLVGATAVLNSDEEEKVENVEPGEALLGILLVMLGAFVQALQYVFEEKVLTMEEADVPPLLLIGMEGKRMTVLRQTVSSQFA